MIIHDPKIIFIHIPKTGGTTIDRLLAANKEVGEVASGFGSHHRLDQLYRKYCGEDTPADEWRDLSEYHTFTVARNPWERYSSLYVHDKYAWESIRRNRKRTFVPVEEYIYNNVSENFFSFIEVNGTIPENLMILNFGEFPNEVRRMFKIIGIKPGRLVHENKKPTEQKKLQEKVINNPTFQEGVAKMCAKEIALFGYDLPVGV